MDVAIGRTVHDETDAAAPVQGRDANSPTHTRIQRLHGDLRTAQHHHRIKRLQRDTSAPFGGCHRQRSSPMLDPRAMIANVKGIQVAHPNTTPDMYL